MLSMSQSCTWAVFAIIAGPFNGACPRASIGQETVTLLEANLTIGKPCVKFEFNNCSRNSPSRILFIPANKTMAWTDESTL